MEIDSTGAAPIHTAILYNRLPLGTVIRTHVLDTDPPKIKIFVIVGYYEDAVITVYFNSYVNTTVNFSQELQALHIPFLRDGRPYLTKDCHCDCSTLISRNKDQIHTLVKEDPDIQVGTLSKDDLDAVMMTLRHSQKLKGTIKNRYGFYEYQTN